jgi:hypothetical protein
LRKAWTLSAEERADLLDHLWSVGRDRAVGYLSLYTVRDLLGLKVREVRAEAASRDLVALRLGPSQCRIKSGAFYVYDRERLAALLADASAAIAGAGWPVEPDGFVRALAAEWVEAGHPVLPVIRRAFRDEAGS